MDACLRGDGLCGTCPGGVHRFVIVEGESAAQVIKTLPAEWRPGTKALVLEMFPPPNRLKVQYRLGTRVASPISGRPPEAGP